MTASTGYAGMDLEYREMKTAEQPTLCSLGAPNASRRWLQAGITLSLAFLLFAFLASDAVTHLRFPDALRYLTNVVGAFAASETQSLTIAFCIFYFFIFEVINLRAARRAKDGSLRPGQFVFLLALVIVGIGWYALGAREDTELKNAPVFFVGLMFGSAAVCLENVVKQKMGTSFRTVFLISLLISIVGLGVSTPIAWRQLHYRAVMRWSGLCDNPNIFGTLMALGLVIAVFVLEDTFNKRGQNWRRVVLSACVAILLLCLFKSYSRAAWLATGLVTVSAAGRLFVPRLRPVLILLIVSCGLLLALNGKYFSAAGIQRGISFSDRNDFSWRNRITTWVGSLQVMAEKPLLGIGWNRALPLYNEFYRPPTLTDGRAIWSNDYFAIGTTLGIPALICFVASLGSPLRRSEIMHQSLLAKDPLHVSTLAYRAALVTLCICLWFDGGFNGGIFTLGTAIPFWAIVRLNRPDALAT